MQRGRFSDLDRTWPAGLGRRLGAMLYDTLVVIALWMVLGFVAVALNGGEANETPLFHSVLLVATFAFFAFSWMRGGMTLGMQAWRLRIQTPEGARISLTQALLRFFVGLASWVALGLGYWWVLFDGEKRSWSDIASGSRVVVLPKK
ncbi:RDD family protein [Bisbaumannia pacifica]|uniref:RDD family protein n=1 Tax=Bisbaumannia pacifica TaxID=77098 RepID=A0A510X5K7_9GAMM|nr:RDD family protein [Halomonas pacifica]MBH8579150.1 RDD family protein [Halomonas pacifica]GEK46698.1 RDD family protein [Halomonas pacifica]